MHLDTLGIFIIGKANCIRLAYSPTVVGGKEPELLPQDKRTEKALTDEGDRLVGREPHSIYTCAHPKKGPGYPITSYQPKNDDQRASWFQYSCTPLYREDDRTMQAVL